MMIYQNNRKASGSYYERSKVYSIVFWNSAKLRGLPIIVSFIERYCKLNVFFSFLLLVF